MGRDIPVIWSVRQDQINIAHLDTRQFNHIIWAEPGELKGEAPEQDTGSFRRRSLDGSTELSFMLHLCCMELSAAKRKRRKTAEL
jgi:hypothetical protein